MLYNLTNISAFFFPSVFRHDFSWRYLRARGFFMRGMGMTFAFSGHFHTYFCILHVYWKWECPRIGFRRPMAYLIRPMGIYVGIPKWVLQVLQWSEPPQGTSLPMSPCNLFPVTDTKHWNLRIKNPDHVTRTRHRKVFFSCTTRKITGVGS